MVRSADSATSCQPLAVPMARPRGGAGPQPARAVPQHAPDEVRRQARLARVDAPGEPPLGAVDALARHPQRALAVHHHALRPVGGQPLLLPEPEDALPVEADQAHGGDHPDAVLAVEEELVVGAAAPLELAREVLEWGAGALLAEGTRRPRTQRRPRRSRSRA